MSASSRLPTPKNRPLPPDTSPPPSRPPLLARFFTAEERAGMRAWFQSLRRILIAVAIILLLVLLWYLLAVLRLGLFLHLLGSLGPTALQ